VVRGIYAKVFLRKKKYDVARPGGNPITLFLYSQRFFFVVKLGHFIINYFLLYVGNMQA